MRLPGERESGEEKAGEKEGKGNPFRKGNESSTRWVFKREAGML